MEKIKNRVGLILFTLYLVQYLVKLEFDYFNQLQTNSTYQYWSGFVLFLFILSQWFLPVQRFFFNATDKDMKRMISSHNWLGVISPVIFYLHSTRPDYGILLFLTVVFFINMLLGLSINSDSLKRYYHIGITFHIFMSVQIIMLVILHIWLVFYYN